MKLLQSDTNDAFNNVANLSFLHFRMFAHGGDAAIMGPISDGYLEHAAHA